MPRVKPARRSALAPPPPPAVRWRASIDDHVVAARPRPAGGPVAAASISGPIAVLDDATGRIVRTLAGHRLGTPSIDWQPGGTTLASGGQDGTVRLWDAVTGRETAAADAGAAWVERVAWSPGGRRLAAAAGRHVSLLDDDGELLQRWSDHPSTVTDVGWSPDGTVLAASSYGGVSLWSPGRDEPRRLGWTGSSLALAWSPTGRHLATGDQDATVHFWIVPEASDFQMSGYATKVRQLAWDAAGRHLATGGGSDVTVWDCSPPGPAGTRPSVVEGDDTLVGVVAGQTRGRMIAFGSEGGRIVVFRAGSGRRSQRIEMGEGVSTLCWHPGDDGLLVGTEMGTVASINLR